MQARDMNTPDNYRDAGYEREGDHYFQTRGEVKAERKAKTKGGNSKPIPAKAAANRKSRKQAKQSKRRNRK